MVCHAGEHWGQSGRHRDPQKPCMLNWCKSEMLWKGLRWTQRAADTHNRKRVIRNWLTLGAKWLNSFGLIFFQYEINISLNAGHMIGIKHLTFVSTKRNMVMEFDSNKEVLHAEDTNCVSHFLSLREGLTPCVLNMCAEHSWWVSKVSGHIEVPGTCWGGADWGPMESFLFDT